MKRKDRKETTREPGENGAEQNCGILVISVVTASPAHLKLPVCLPTLVYLPEARGALMLMANLKGTNERSGSLP